MRRRPVALALVMTLVPAASAHAAFTARGSVEQVQGTGAKAGSRLVLRDRHGRRVAAQRAGSLGGAVFRNVKPGRGYRIRSRHVTVLADRAKPPSTKLYDRKVPTSGYGYLTTRD